MNQTAILVSFRIGSSMDADNSEITEWARLKNWIDTKIYSAHHWLLFMELWNIVEFGVANLEFPLLCISDPKNPPEL